MKKGKLSRLFLVFATALASLLLCLPLFTVEKVSQQDLSVLASSGFTNVRNLESTNSSFRFQNTFIYKVSGTVVCNDSLIANGINVIYLEPYAELTVNASSNVYAALDVDVGKVLIIVGREGSKVNAYGAIASNGENGSNGSNGSVNTSSEWYYGGAGGRGGRGGHGASAGIGGGGGRGGYGGYGGAGTSAECTSGNHRNGNNGSSGEKGSNGYGMGTVYILGDVEVTARGGSPGNTSGTGGAAGTGTSYKWWNRYSAGGGGGGGGGAKGWGGDNIGSGGPGGSGGGGGASGGVFASGKYEYLPGGEGGDGGVSFAVLSQGGTGEDASWNCDGGVTRGIGGACGSYGSFGERGTLYIQNSTTCSGRTRDYSSDGKISHLQYTATFDLAGGSGVSSASVYLCQYMNTVSKPSKTGYTFQGYYTGQNGTGTKYYNSDGSSARKWDIIGDTTLYAYWTPNSYTIYFDMQEGSGGTRSIGATYNSSLYNITIPNKSGYYFEGYYTARNGGGIKYYNANGTGARVWNIASNTTLYANWKPNVYSTTFAFNGGIANGSTSHGENLEFGQKYTFPSAKKTGYILARWTTNSSTESFICDSNGELTRTIPDLGVNGASVIFSAQWEALKYPLTADANISEASFINLSSEWSGSGLTRTKGVLYDSSYGELPKVEREGYDFVGWFDAESGGDAVSSSTIMNSTSGSTIYAHWSIKSFTLTLNANGGSLSGENSKVLQYGAEYGTLPTPEKDGYIFKGWFKSLTESDSVGSKTKMGAADATIYAHWEKTWAAEAEDVTFGHEEADPSMITGEGTQRSPFIIKNEKQMAFIALQVSKGASFNSVYFKQAANLDFIDFVWLPIGSQNNRFGGNFDGNGYLIRNLYTFKSNKTMYSNVGLFGYTVNSTLKNINILSGEFYGNENVGAIVGNLNFGTIENCRSGINVYIESSNACGLVGRANNANIKSCYMHSRVFGNKYVGGIVGKCEEGAVTIENCYSKAIITTNENFGGGIVGFSSVSQIIINACGFDGQLNGEGVSAIAGYLANGNISNSFSNSHAADLYKGTTVLNSVIYSIDTEKRYVGSDFSAWSVSARGIPLPAGFSWLGSVGTPLNIEILSTLGYQAQN